MKKSILTIEDSKALNYVLATTFKNEFDVLTATSYSEAFNFLRLKQFVDLIIIDIPSEESDNYRFLAHLSSSSLFYDIPKIVISNSMDSRLSNKVKMLGASMFLSTPFDPVYLYEKVRGLICSKETVNFFAQATFTGKFYS